MGASLHPVPASPEEGAHVAEQRRQFEDFFLAEHDRLYRALCIVTGSRQESEEVMQDAFLRLWERRNGICSSGRRSGSIRPATRSSGCSSAANAVGATGGSRQPWWPLVSSRRSS